ncbi:MAG: helix-turn-helix transcriptional regulator [Chitinophagaceae bacterium]|nr:helix-turn-helix transcriptional regulator [Oligoflexus sp.]
MDGDSLSSEIGKGLQWLRKSLLLTQYQLASFTELDYRHYQNIETGRVEVKVETLKRICSTFGVGLSTFFLLIDRKPWLTEGPTRTKGGGDLYLFRMILEQASFRVLNPVREAVSKWGRDIAEGTRENLGQCPFPSLEVDAELKVLWKNASAQSLWIDGERDTGFPSRLLSDHLKEEIANFFARHSHSFYFEVLRNPLAERDGKHYAIVGLKPMMARATATFFLAFIELGEKEFENGTYHGVHGFPHRVTA